MNGEAPALRIPWSDWLLPEPARFDLQEMLEFCQAMPDGWSVRILNATGRIGGHAPAGALQGVAEVEVRFPDGRCAEAFHRRFAGTIAAARRG